MLSFWFAPCMFYHLRKKKNPVLLIKYLFVHKILLEKIFFQVSYEGNRNN